MGILIDVILVLILVLNIVLGYKRGLINVIFSICAFFIAIILTLILFKPISNLIINNTEIDNKIREVIIHNNSNKDDANIAENEKNKESSNPIKNYIDSTVKQTTDTIKTNTVEIIANEISVRIIEIITGIILFIVIRIILIFAKFLFEAIAELPIIKQFNEIGGIAYGLLKGVLIIYLLLTIIFVVTSIKGKNIIYEKIEESYITKVLYENNVIIDYCLLPFK